jgi:hypothetical protein
LYHGVANITMRTGFSENQVIFIWRVLMSALKTAKSRENGALSQGPVTAEGRARSSQNATKLGIFS